MDGQSVEGYENWDENAIKDGNDKCVQLSLSQNNLGEWTDNCNKKYLIACQKKQSSKNVLQQQINNLTNNVNNLGKQVESFHQDIIPINFLYTQLPNQSLPEQIWPQFQWKDVTQQYSGLFFRAEGEGSEKFGTIQSSNQSWISNSITYGCKLNEGGHDCVSGYGVMKKNQWSDNVNVNHYSHYLHFFTTDGEVRPKNTAIKIWIRVK